MTQYKIKRKELELGEFTLEAVFELVKTNFLLPEDTYWHEASGSWMPISALEHNEAEAQYKKITGKLGAVWNMAQGVAAVAYDDVKKRTGGWMARHDSQIKAAQAKLIEDYLPQVRIIIFEKVLPGMKTTAHELLKNEPLLQKSIHAAYLLLPPSVQVFVKEDRFREILWAQREKLLNDPRFL